MSPYASGGAGGSASRPHCTLPLRSRSVRDARPHKQTVMGRLAFGRAADRLGAAAAALIWLRSTERRLVDSIPIIRPRPPQTPPASLQTAILRVTRRIAARLIPPICAASLSTQSYRLLRLDRSRDSTALAGGSRALRFLRR